MMQVPPGSSLLAGSRTWSLWAFAAWAVTTALALLSIWLSRSHSPKVKVIWSVLALVPLLGPAGWFVLGRERRRT